MKAILVIDRPKACGYCDLMGCEREDDGYHCHCYAHDMDKIVVNVLEDRPDWCPLRPLPKWIKDGPQTDWQDGFNVGWNACLTAVTREV